MAKILLVIGLSKVRTDMSNMLRLQGHEVMTAEGEQSGRALASRDKPDLAIIEAGILKNNRAIPLKIRRHRKVYAVLGDVGLALCFVPPDHGLV